MFVASARRRTGRAPATGPALWATLFLAFSLALSGCSGSDPAPAPRAKPTPLAQLNTTGLTVPRIAFCSLVPKKAASDALGGKATAATSWGNGERASVTPGVRDVVHELGCEWRGEGGVAARAWVFARPVTPQFARGVVVAGSRDKRCPAEAGATFGQPSITQVCRTGAGDSRVRHAGLFGQTWLSCEVEAAGGSATALRKRADAWCVQVVTALDRVR